jgi:uncharacterized damage-inducible protein DinB
MTSVEAMIDRYSRGGAQLREAVRGLSADQLDAHPVAGTWSIREIVVHLLDSDLAATHRMRRIAAEEGPLLIAYDETAFAARLGYEQADLELVLRLFEDQRRFTADWLRRLDPEAFERWGVHNQRGKVTLADMVRLYAEHVDHHLKFIVSKREMVSGR